MFENDNLQLILDIDDTLADTAVYLNSLVINKYGHAMNPKDLARKYFQPGYVPEWKAQEIQDFIWETLNTEEFLMNLPVLEGAEVVNEIIKKFPIKAYITSRLESTHEYTVKWLKENNFPDAQIISRKEGVEDRDWKIKFLIKEGWHGTLFIDNDAAAFETDLAFYHGKMIWLDAYKYSSLSNPKVLTASSWEEIAKILL